MWKSPHSRPLPKFGERPLIMGILNLTPDSFSDGGKFFTPDAAQSHSLEMLEDGADIIDVGAESTRPNAIEVSLENEKNVLLPYIKSIRKKTQIAISVDTYKPEVARAAVLAGVDIINDVYCRIDSSGYPMARVAAELNCPLIVTHDCRGKSVDDNFWQFLSENIKRISDLAIREGVAESQLVIDPGVGFGKTVAQNFEIVQRLAQLRSLGFPILLGASRKSFLAQLVGDGIALRDAATIAVSTFAAVNFSADILRVHDVKSNLAAVKVGVKLSKKI